MTRVVQVIIDRTTPMVIQGVYNFDRVEGGALVIPSGTAFPGTPEPGELYWRTDLNALYRRNDGNTAWDATSSAPSVASVKAGVIVPGSFSGDPKKATVTFGTAFGGTSYAVVLSTQTDGTKTYAPAAETKTAGGFVVNLHSNNVANLVEVEWHCILNGG